MYYDNLPIFKSALDLVVYVETIVENFDKYHRYTLGEDLRQYSKALLFLIQRANMSENRVPKLIELRDKCEEIKMLIRVTQELRVFKGFKKAQYLDRYEALKGTMELAEIKQFLSVQAPFSGHIKHVPDRRDKCPWGANSYKLLKKVGYIDEKNPFDYVRA